ncbi:hypothetical protein PRECH8_25140 [Insulibacter thermoxylanivorax]|uniref:Uncharacterized protein n=1 Tax=Insulibacter thermoxylanivorax TaxID=2749268 RepID=A0A916VGP7_9BACL|nr:hypothetical protein [Insulibacter thermoxylanivorax]GFR39218.1 hypothetical protein PRECH8_25140 [Insulibacter thermoxylanivorax]
MRNKVLFLASTLILVFTSTTYASTFYNAGNSSPQTVWVYGTNVWSREGIWDLKNDSNIPDGATIDLISVAYDICTTYLGCGMNYNNTHVALFNSQGNGYYITSGIYITNFRGEPAKQIWTTQYWVSNNLVGGRGWIKPVLRLYWNDPVTGTFGLTTINSNGDFETIEESAITHSIVARKSDARVNK